MIAALFNRLVVALVALALLGGPTALLIASARAMDNPDTAMSGSVPCEQMNMAGKESDKAPCKSMTFDCMMQMGCFVANPSIAAATPTLVTPVAYTAVRYGLVSIARTGLSLAPDPFPPKSFA